MTRQGSCTICRIPFDDLVCHEPWPREHDVERCECGAVVSFRWLVETMKTAIGEVKLYERKRIAG